MAPPVPPPPPPQSLDYWRGFFSGAQASIFDAIDAAIRVAAADNPDGLRARRDSIAERLFTALPPAEAAAAAAPASRLPPLKHQPQQLLPEGAGSVPSLSSSDRPEAVITYDGASAGGAAAPRRDCDDDAVVAEAFRVKDALSSNQQKSEDELLDLLRRLQRLEFTVKTIRVTEIGTAVKPLRKHSSKQIRQLVRSLIEGWKAIVTEWVSNEGDIIDHTPQSVDASCLEEEEGGLPSPPMDEAALFATPCSSIQLAEFFDEMDDDGNLRVNAKESEQQYPTNQEPVKKQSSPMGQWYDPVKNWRLDEPAVRQSQPRMGQQSITEAQEKPSTAAFGPGRPQRLHFEPEGSERKSKPQQDTTMAQRRPKPDLPNLPSSQHDPNSVRSKLELAKNAKIEATKRKLQEGYQEFSNAKKQRTIQMVDPQNLPNQGNRRLQPNGKPRNNHSSNLHNRLGIRR